MELLVVVATRTFSGPCAQAGWMDGKRTTTAWHDHRDADVAPTDNRTVQYGTQRALFVEPLHAACLLFRSIMIASDQVHSNVV